MPKKICWFGNTREVKCEGQFSWSRATSWLTAAAELPMIDAVEGAVVSNRGEEP